MSSLARIEKVVFLQSVELFGFCKAEEILRIAAISSECSYAAGETIYELNDPAAALYCVVRGEVSLTDGEQESDWVPPLGTFGVTEILSGRLRRSSAKAKTDVLLLAIDEGDFFDLLSNNIEIVKALFRRVTEQGS